MVYKWCVVPQCTNTSINNPQKLFVSVPTNPKRRKMWLQLSRRDPKSILSHSNVFMCEDHFDMEKDTINYMKYKMGFSQKILLTDKAVPTKFHCQEDRKRRLSDAGSSREVFLKRHRMGLVTECLQTQNATETHAESLQKDENMIQEIIEPEGTGSKKCAKCGISSKEYPSLTFHRFPLPSKYGSLKAKVWAKSCFPDKDWTHESLVKLYTDHKMLCGNHFDDSSYTSSDRKRLNKFAIPTEAQNIISQLCDHAQCNTPKDIQITQHWESTVEMKREATPSTSQCSNHEEHEVSSFSEDTDVMYFQSDVNITTDPTDDRSLPEVPNVAGPFTWHNPTEVMESDDADDAQYITISTKMMTDDVLLYNDDKSSAINTCEITNQDVSTNAGDVSSQREKQLQYYKEYKCNHCSGPIEGFRYRCVQCADYDLCAACEARGTHDNHYVLRIPGSRPYAEIDAVLQKIKTELLSGGHSVFLKDTQMLDSVKEEIKDEEQDPLLVDPTSPMDPLFGNADDAHSEAMSNVSHSDKEEFEQQGCLEDNDFKREKRKRSDSISEHYYSIRRDNLQTYSSKGQNSSNKKLIVNSRIQKPGEKTTQESHDLDNRKFLITKPGEKYVTVKNFQIVKNTLNIVPDTSSDPKVLVTRPKLLNTTVAFQVPANNLLPGILLNQTPTTSVHPSNNPRTQNILKKT